MEIVGETHNHHFRVTFHNRTISGEVFPHTIHPAGRFGVWSPNTKIELLLRGPGRVPALGGSSQLVSS